MTNVCQRKHNIEDIVLDHYYFNIFADNERFLLHMITNSCKYRVPKILQSNRVIYFYY